MRGSGVDVGCMLVSALCPMPVACRVAASGPSIRPGLLCHTVEAAFANMELADREDDSFGRTEGGEPNHIGCALSSTRDVGSLREQLPLCRAQETQQTSPEQ